jgi:crossover junction endodeoxyribonuclease RuvC
MVILGIDPGSRITGFGVIDVHADKYTYIASGAIKTASDEMSVRLLQIFQGVNEVIQMYHPEVAAIEQVFMHRNPNSALKLGQARGAALVALAQQGLSISEYSPRQIKQSVVGYGAAGKGQVQYMMKQLLQLSSEPPPDPADALAVAVCHSMFLRRAGLY